MLYLNWYKCDCGCEWSNEDDSTCDDRCPQCNTSTTPVASEEIEE